MRPAYSWQWEWQVATEAFRNNLEDKKKTREACLVACQRGQPMKIALKTGEPREKYTGCRRKFDSKSASEATLTTCP